MNEENTVSFGIKDELCRKSGITAAWVNGSVLSVSAFNPITSTTKDAPSSFNNQHEVNVHHLQTEFVFDEPILRSLLAEANSTFLAIQNLKKTGTRTDFVNISRTYRSIIRACLEKLERQLAKDSDTDKTKYQNFVTIFYSIECVWHLCEILYIDPTPSNVVVPQLLRWIRFHFPSSERDATDILLHGRDADTRADYWPIVTGLIIQGQVDVARAILKLHSDSETEEFRMADQVLRTMPAYNPHVQKYRSQWQYWLSDTELKLSSKLFSKEQNLEEIIKLVTGNQYTWNEELKKSSSWYEYFPGFLFYTDPACKYFELGTAANLWLNRWANQRDFPEGGLLNHLDRIILNVMENDMHQVLPLIQKMCDNQWFVTHLTDLLYHCGKLHILGEQRINVTSALRDSLLFEFGSTLMSRDSFWLIGADYLESCSVEGLGAIELFLTKLPVESEKHAHKIIDVARRKGLPNVESEICKVQSRRSMARNRYGNALEWAIRSKDVTLVTSIADYFLTHYSKTGDITCHDVLSHIGAKMLISPRLVFLVKYFDFQQFYKKREFGQAAELLVNLLDSKITPEYFWPSLLIDTIPLLESKDPKIPSKETYIILHHLESELVPLVEKSKEKNEIDNEAPVLFRDYRIENIEDIVKLIRLACARNLARAIIIENTGNYLNN